MPFFAMLLAMLAANAPHTPTTREPIMVTGHAWAPFISPMGEPFRARTREEDTLATWFNQADRNHDGALTPDEMVADGERFFATLDTNRDQRIDPDELVQYEWDIAPDIQIMSRTRPPPGQSRAKPSKGADSEFEQEDAPPGGLQGAARYALLNMPEPVAAADADLNRIITAAEFRQAALARFSMLDGTSKSRLGLAELQALRTALTTYRKRKASEDRPDARIGTPLPPGN
jgi:hypothetical protein